MMRTTKGRPAAGLRLETLEVRETPAVVGGLDPSFGTAGKFTQALAGVTVEDVAVDSFGRTVVVGTAPGTGVTDLVVYRLTPAGALDTSFDTDGKVTVDFAGGQDAAGGVTVDANNNVVVVGSSTVAGVSKMAFARLTAAAGALDTAFGTGGSGKLLVAAPAGYTGLTGTDVATDTTGAVVAVGTAQNIGNGDFAVVRLNTAGTGVDAAFNGGAVKTIAAPGDETANAVAVGPGNKIVVAGTSIVGGASKFAVAELTTTGAAVAEFAGGNLLAFNTAAGTSDVANGVDVDAAGNIYLTGTSTLAGVSKLAVARVSATGTPDGTFGTAGVYTVDVAGQGQTFGEDLRVDRQTGRIDVVGTTKVSATDYDLVALRLLPTGALDTGFNPAGTTPGVARIDFGANSADFTAALDVAPTGRIVVAGQNSTTNGVEVARLIGSVDEGRLLAVGGSKNGTATVFAPDLATGKIGTTAAFTAAPFGGFTGNVRTAVGDVNGDEVDDLAVVTGPGDAPTRFAVISGADGKTQLIAPTDPFGNATFTGGGFVSVGDFNNDGRAEVILTPDQGGGPNVVIYTLGADGKAAVVQSFTGIADEAFRGGARSAVGDFNGDGVVDLAVAAGFLGGPRVAVYDGKSLGTAGVAPVKLVANDFFAFDGPDAQTLRNGVFIAAGDLNGDGFAELIAGGGPGGGPRVLAVSGKILTGTGANTGIVAAQAAPILNFFVAGNEADRGGVRLATLDADGDNRADLAVGSGEGLPSQVRVYLGKNITASTEPATVQSFDPFNQTLPGGVFVG